MIGGLLALVSLVFPWVTFLGVVSSNLITFVSELWGSRPTDIVLVFGASLALIMVILGGVFSLLHPAGGIASLIGSVVFLVTVPYLQGGGPYVALFGGILALSGLFFPGLVRVIPLRGQVASGSYQSGGGGIYPESPVPLATPPTERFCPACGARYPGDYRVCPKDTTELKDLG